MILAQLRLTISFLVEFSVYPGLLKRVDVGPFGVWGVNSQDQIYKKTPNSWQRIQGVLRDISVGQNSVWGTNKWGIYMRVGEGDWQKINGMLRQVG